MSFSTVPSRSDSVRSSNKSTSTSESLLQKISKHTSFPQKALTRTRSLLHRTRSTRDAASEFKRSSKAESDDVPVARSNTEATRGSWHGLFEFERSGTRKLAPELSASTSYDRWPKLVSLNPIRRDSGDSGYESRRASETSWDDVKVKWENASTQLEPTEDPVRKWSSPRSAIYPSSKRSSLLLDLTKDQVCSPTKTISRRSTLDAAAYTPLPAVEQIGDCPDLETASTCSDLSCSIDDLLDSDWPDLGIECVTDEIFFARKKQIADMLNAPANLPEREAWWTCEIAQPTDAGRRFAEFRRSLYMN